MNDLTERYDEGFLIDKKHLPITEVCMGYDENRPGQDQRGATLDIKKFRCRPNQAGG
jgi:hypothetical protein